MPVTLNFEICQTKCDQLKFTDITGSYSTSNTGGWGTPNNDVAEGSLPKLIIKDLNEEELFNIDLPSDFPADDGTTNTLIDFDEDFTDGVYIMEYMVTLEDATELSTSKYIFLSCEANCCSQKAYSKATTGCDPCDEDALALAVKIDAYLKGAKYAAVCGDIVGAQKLLKLVQYLCNSKNCRC